MLDIEDRNFPILHESSRIPLHPCAVCCPRHHIPTCFPFHFSLLTFSLVPAARCDCEDQRDEGISKHFWIFSPQIYLGVLIPLIPYTMHNPLLFPIPKNALPPFSLFTFPLSLLPFNFCLFPHLPIRKNLQKNIVTMSQIRIIINQPTRGVASGSSSSTSP